MKYSFALILRTSLPSSSLLCLFLNCGCYWGRGRSYSIRPFKGSDSSGLNSVPSSHNTYDPWTSSHTNTLRGRERGERGTDPCTNGPQTQHLSWMTELSANYSVLPGISHTSNTPAFLQPPLRLSLNYVFITFSLRMRRSKKPRKSIASLPFS